MDTERVRAEFEAEVNMSPSELERWLATGSSAEVGQHHGAEESVGHRSGRRIVEILRTNRADLSADDYEHMRAVVGYIHRHRAQRPSGDVRDTRWRYSLMNWGHDPLKDTR
ncbi:DUF3140 domain-containing protein [Saccharomonospora saliphila]|uniref:DUF3140 domain-containing protein n=1 Tax=Saccharomonospora saliphila TaxID=369829 RepID=UPI0003666107|nr:DUF3140 domain-containing protein [Saccharomonospora saliphila]